MLSLLALLPIVLFITAVICLPLGIYIVPQQNSVVIERLGKFNRITGPGIHLLIPVVERKATCLSMKTGKLSFRLDAKTSDNVTIVLEVSAQYHVDYDNGNGNAVQSGVYRAFYMLADPISQMQDYLSDALRSSIPAYTLDDVFSKKDDIARDVNANVAGTMQSYGWTLVSTLITGINLPTSVEKSMNDINAAQRQREAAQSLADADKIKRVTSAQAEAEAMEKTGRGIAAQRIAIAQGIKDSLDTIKESGVSEAEANELFLYTQFTEMMTTFAKEGRASTVVLPTDFNESRSMFQQMLAAHQVHDNTRGEK
ncbi:SPFH domain-containing protein [Cryptobacterium curtum]|uniref:SPFH domain-containing protein n=1 Tax=Cryptobacterium curtum TaxID=84163 RepID=UPI00248EEF94|nr:SPFH domain-containing protein [Cryptobacterium curtum]